RPELTRVIVSLGTRVAMAETFQQALTEVLGGGPPAPPPAPPTPDPDAAASPPSEGAELEDPERSALILQAAELYREAQQRLREGDFAGYGRLIEALGEVLETLAAAETGTEDASR